MTAVFLSAPRRGWLHDMFVSVPDRYDYEAVEVAVDPALTDRSPTQACSPHVEEGVGSKCRRCGQIRGRSRWTVNMVGSGRRQPRLPQRPHIGDDDEVMVAVQEEAAMLDRHRRNAAVDAGSPGHSGRQSTS